MTDETETSNATADRHPQPLRVRLPGFVAEENIGLGDVVTRVTSAFGIRPCGGCLDRAAPLNRWMAFSRRQ
jgi:hypothetical protein